MTTLEFRECSFKSVPDIGKKLIWEVTHKCHFGCAYCFQAKKRMLHHQRVLHTNDLRIIGEKLTELGVRSAIVSGGEIFHVRDILPEICTDLNRRNIPYSFSTAFIHDDNFMNYLMNFSPKAINLSFDPQGCESTDQYHKIIFHTRNILEKGDRFGVRIKLTGVITQENIQSINSYLGILESMVAGYNSISSIYITNPYDIGYIKNNVRVDDDSLIKLIQNIEQNKISQKIKFINFHKLNSPLQKCYAGEKIIHIEPDGSVYPCHLLANFHGKDFLVGNIVTDSASQIDKKLRVFHKQANDAVNEYKELNNFCHKCDYAHTCGGGCIAEIISIDHIKPHLVCNRIKSQSTVEKTTILRKGLSVKSHSSENDLTPQEESMISAHIAQHIQRSGHDLAHGFDHVIAVVRLARYIGKNEGANLRVVTAAAYFHDFEPRRKLIFSSHTKVSAEKAIIYLREIGFDEDELYKIFHCIDTSSYGASELGFIATSLEAKCVGDADWIDAIGARGIARVFAFGAAHGCEELGEVKWDIYNPPKLEMSRIGPDPSPIYHFFSKLLWVKEKIQTSTGKKLAEERHRRLEFFLDQYKEEMDFGK